jgi:hypothetical protein
MDDDVRAFGTELGRKALGREWAAVHAMLAQWLRATWTGPRALTIRSIRSLGWTVTGSPRPPSFVSRYHSLAGRCGPKTTQ